MGIAIYSCPGPSWPIDHAKEGQKRRPWAIVVSIHDIVGLQWHIKMTYNRNNCLVILTFVSLYDAAGNSLCCKADILYALCFLLVYFFCYMHQKKLVWREIMRYFIHKSVILPSDSSRTCFVNVSIFYSSSKKAHK